MTLELVLVIGKFHLRNNLFPRILIDNSVTGTVGAAVAGLTGNSVEQAKRQEQHDVGKSLQRGVEADLQKQVDATK
jgi:hypothetical protein